MASQGLSAPGCPNCHLRQARCGAAQWLRLGDADRSEPLPAAWARPSRVLGARGRQGRRQAAPAQPPRQATGALSGMICGGWAAWVGYMGMYVPTWCAAVHGMFVARHRLAAVLLGGMGLLLHVMA